MDDVPFLFVNAVLHCLNSESLSAPRPLWSSVAEEHHQKRKDYGFQLSNQYMDKCQFFVGQKRKYQYLTPEEWLRLDKTHLIVREMYVCSTKWTNTPYRTFEEAVQWSRGMAPYLNDIERMIVSMYLGDENERFDFLWKRPCRTLSYCRTDTSVLRWHFENNDRLKYRPCLTLSYYKKDTSVMKWHLENNDRLKRIATNLFSYDEVHDLLPLCAEKRLTWRMRFDLCSNTLKSVKTWQGDAQWDEIYPLVTNERTYVVPAQPEKGSAFYEDEHIRKEFLWTSDDGSSLTITWK
uniref:F-box domain-containing protein n=1 Tax=Steinernema glaseri TaxID=37863 RepID=A0A1I7Y2R6_9BILA